MNENLDLREILKNASEGLELWSYACGTCYFEQIVKYTDYPIVCRTIGKDGQIRSIEFTKEGKRDTIYSNGKCVLFPSETNHDWSTFKIENKNNNVRDKYFGLKKFMENEIVKNLKIKLETEYDGYVEAKLLYKGKTISEDTRQIITDLF